MQLVPVVASSRIFGHQTGAGGRSDLEIHLAVLGGRPREWSIIANLRGKLALLSCLAVVSWATVALGLEGVLNTPAEPQQRASNAGGSYPLTKDEGFLVASAEELVADEPAASDAVATDSVMSNVAAPNLSCGCDCPCDSCCSCGCCGLPLWVVSAGAVILHRDRPSDGIIVANNPGATTAFGSLTARARILASASA